MSTTVAFTAEQLLALPLGKGDRYELVAGELRMMSPAGWAHGEVAYLVQTLLGQFILANRLGRGFAAETGFLLQRNPDTVRAPDFGFIALKNLPSTDPTEAYWPGAPDLAVEVLSPGDTVREVDEKISTWLDAGCQEVWIVDPGMQTVTIYQSRTTAKLLTAEDKIDGGTLLPGFSCPVSSFFR